MEEMLKTKTQHAEETASKLDSLAKFSTSEVADMVSKISDIEQIMSESHNKMKSMAKQMSRLERSSKELTDRLEAQERQNETKRLQEEVQSIQVGLR